MSKLEVDKIDPQSGTDLEIGSSGDTITIPTGATLGNGAGSSLTSSMTFTLSRSVDGDFSIENVTAEPSSGVGSGS